MLRLDFWSPAFLRLVWNPAHFVGEKLQGTAFSSDDLLGRPDSDGQSRYLSVDSRDEVVKDSVDWRISWQRRDGKAEANHRHEARFVVFEGRAVRELTCPANGPLFDVTREPLAEGADGPGSPANPAHCGIRNVSDISGMSKGQQRARVDYMRVKLLKAKAAIQSYDEVFESTGPSAGMS